MEKYKKTYAEKQATKKAFSLWKHEINKKYPLLVEQGYSANEIWLKNLTINTKVN